jgi:hypothetical protein
LGSRCSFDRHERGSQALGLSRLGFANSYPPVLLRRGISCICEPRLALSGLGLFQLFARFF